MVDAIRELDIGILVASAGFGTSGSFLASLLEVEREMLQVNCGAVMELMHIFGKRFQKRTHHRSAIVLMSSIVAFQGVAGAAQYAATKAYIQSLGEGLRAEFANCNIDLLTIAPGPVASEFGTRAGMTMARAASAKSVAAETIAALGISAFVRPGFLSKVMGYSLATLPRPIRVSIMSQIMSGMTNSGS
jgi:short-subunit dehydrogenase